MLELFIALCFFWVDVHQPMDPKTLDEMVGSLDNESYAIRNKATIALRKEIVKEVDPVVMNRMLLEAKNESPEVRWRAKDVIESFYKDADYAYVPIWYLPESERFPDETDVAYVYYMKAKERYESQKGSYKYTGYNHSYTMRLATHMYIRDQLEKRVDRESLFKIIDKMKCYCDKEQAAVKEIYYYFYSDNRPSKVEERIEKLEKWVADQKSGEAPVITYEYAPNIPEHLRESDTNFIDH